MVAVLFQCIGFAFGGGVAGDLATISSTGCSDAGVLIVAGTWSLCDAVAS